MGRADAADVSTDRPQPLLRVRDAVGLIVGIVVGAGIFSAPAVVAANAGTPLVALAAWVVGGIIAVAGAMCYAELAATYPNAGGDYHYLKLAFGRNLSFLFAWARLTVIPTGSIALLAYVFGDYSSQIYSLGPQSSAIYASFIIIVLTAINVAGLQQGKSTQNLLTIVEVAGLALVIIGGLLLIPIDAAPAAASPVAGATNWGLVLVFVMLTYGGWNEAAYVSAEMRGSGRDLARALLISLALVTVLYLLINVAYLNALGLAGMSESQAVAADTMRRALGAPGAHLVSLLVAISSLTSINATILTGARTTYAFGCDTPLFSALGRWRGGAPVNALLAQAAIALALVLLGSYTRTGFQTMVEYTAPVFWFFFLLAGLSLFVLRRRDPASPRPFRVPLYPWTPILFVLTSVYLLYASVRHTGIGALVGIAVLACGLPVMWYCRVRRPQLA